MPSWMLGCEAEPVIANPSVRYRRTVLHYLGDVGRDVRRRIRAMPAQVIHLMKGLAEFVNALAGRALAAARK